MKKIGDTIARRKVLIEDGSSISFPPLNQRTILFFYPKDNTPGCTAEACSLRDGHREFGELGYEVFGISVDSVSSHHKFIEKHTLPYHLISDADKKMVESKSMKLYLFSFRNHGGFHEDCIQTICDDLVQLMQPKYIEVIGEFTPSGGIAILTYAQWSNRSKEFQQLLQHRRLNYAPCKYSLDLSRIY